MQFLLYSLWVAIVIVSSDLFTWAVYHYASLVAGNRKRLRVPVEDMGELIFMIVYLWYLSICSSYNVVPLNKI